MSNSRIEEIEFLRAVAIVMVLLVHGPFVVGWHMPQAIKLWGYISLGTGVDLFFAISGFVITRSLLRSSPVPFWIRRAFRIFPAAWLWIALYLFATTFLNSSGAFGVLADNAIDAVAAFLQVLNIHYARCVIATGLICSDGGVPLGIYWSLSLEEQFYLVLPLLFILPRKIAVAALVGALFYQLQFLGARPELLNWIRCDGIILGVLLALWSEHPSYQRFRPSFLENSAAQWTVFVCLIAALITVNNFTRLGFGGVAIISASLVFLASRGYMPKFPFASWIGSRSFSLYLCHFGAYAGTKELWSHLSKTQGPVMDVPYIVTALVLLFLLAELTYRFVEKPFRETGVRLSRRFSSPSRSTDRLQGRGCRTGSAW
jgi:peptidoglycan/LPS O-acetylase OafA/YrhL